MENSPCHYCQKRFPGCHGKCKDYKIFHEGREKVRQKRLQEMITIPKPNYKKKPRK